MSDELNLMHNKWWFPLYEFAVHVFVGTLIFIIIALPAVGLNVSIHYLSKLQVDPVVLLGLSVTEYCLFAADLVLFFVFIFSSVLKAGKKLWQ
ncbi:MAG: hypothetical protein DM484_11980 [Candidatus Methylumidiphilus alinenensis]|uniref:Uncharacterized protein n=1 Tax=Candidatus Methylumidiphilus alinenensis TaxID=2202197 RepID=A0A2W4R3Z8_9GAMM|nr:MAG: hypothetical protein DM484_11980 [Candidatus Methylumidiphilus alinenensis]